MPDKLAQMLQYSGSNGGELVLNKDLIPIPSQRIQSYKPAYSIEGNFPGLLEKGNMDIMNRPLTPNLNGQTSTVRSASFNIDGKEVLIPTVSLDGSRLLSNQEALNQYRTTGVHLGKFENPDAATRYAQALHLQQQGMFSGSPIKDMLMKGAGKR